MISVMKTINIDATRPYPIHIAPGLLKSALLFELCTSLAYRTVILCDENLLKTHGVTVQQTLIVLGLKTALLSCPSGEQNKTRETKAMLEDQLLSLGYTRDTCVIALGGGVTLDLVGFLCATYCRGIPVIYIPTTVLAMVDASIGGKTGVNTTQGKNMIGTITPPYAVLMDTDILNTLSDNEYKQGMVELIKHALIADTLLFSRLCQETDKILNRDPLFLNEIIHESCLIKKQIIEQDEQDQGIRNILNFGHTVGHAIETLENHERSHGEAVAIGMLVAGQLSVNLGLLDEAPLQALVDLLKTLGLPLQTQAFDNPALLLQTLSLDKKFKHGKPHMVLLEGIGNTHLSEQGYTLPIDPGHLSEAISQVQERYLQAGQ